MARKMPDRMLAFLAVLAVAAGVLIPAVSFAGEIPWGGVTILAPQEGAVLRKGNVLVIGKITGRGGGNVEIYVNGKGRQLVEFEDAGFYAKVPLVAGKNEIRVHMDQFSAAVHVTAEEAPRLGAYAYHEGVEKCEECHGKRGKGFAVPSPRDALCYRCHDRQDKGKLAHGPMGNGDCTSCHDPHGSVHKAMVRWKDEKLCIACHDQKSSEEHFRKSKGKSCTTCHDPHSSNKAFLQR